MKLIFLAAEYWQSAERLGNRAGNGSRSISDDDCRLSAARTPFPIWRRRCTMLLCLAACWGGVMLGQTPAAADILWPANGVVLAALLMLPRRYWIGYLVGSFASNVLVHAFFPFPMEKSLIFSVANLVEITFAAFCLSLHRRRRPDFAQIPTLGRFFLFGVVLAPSGFDHVCRVCAQFAVGACRSDCAFKLVRWRRAGDCNYDSADSGRRSTRGRHAAEPGQACRNGGNPGRSYAAFGRRFQPELAACDFSAISRIAVGHLPAGHYRFGSGRFFDGGSGSQLYGAAARTFCAGDDRFTAAQHRAPAMLSRPGAGHDVFHLRRAGKRDRLQQRRPLAWAGGQRSCWNGSRYRAGQSPFFRREVGARMAPRSEG